MINNEILPQALMMGVDYELFWVLNPKSLAPFVKAYNLGLKEKDYNAWLQGQYFAMAIASNFSKNYKYPKKPLFTDKDFEKVNEISDTEKLKNVMLAKMASINHKFRKEETA